ncbi:hypothetical protein Q667_19115 [Marinobacter sp. C1S70]|nr:hypothetical protein Q667_19115 [Marinobacter sp. C1S70]
MSGNGGNLHSLRDLPGTYEKSGLEREINLVRRALVHLDQFRDTPTASKVTKTARDHLAGALGDTQMTQLESLVNVYQLKRLRSVF